MNERRGIFWDAVAGKAPPGTAPAAEMLGWKVLDVDPERGTIRVQYEAKRDFLNPFGAVQGGFVTAMLDEAMGPALFATLPPDRAAVTIELKVNFIGPARPGTLVAEGRVVHRGQSIAFLAGELRNAAGELIATATATARIVEAR